MRGGAWVDIAAAVRGAEDWPGDDLGGSVRCDGRNPGSFSDTHQWEKESCNFSKEHRRGAACGFLGGGRNRLILLIEAARLV